MRDPIYLLFNYFLFAAYSTFSNSLLHSIEKNISGLNLFSHLKVAREESNSNLGLDYVVEGKMYILHDCLKYLT